MPSCYDVAHMDDNQHENDHRRLGQELDLFVFSDLVGSGLPLFTPRGVVLRDELARYANELREKAGFKKVWTPHITKTDLYKKSGHWDKFGKELFLVKSQETKDEMVLKPMNCPHHTQIYASRPRSYRELPIKFIETTTDYRDEKSGELNGLFRVRSLTQDDSHVFCRPDQIAEAVESLVTAVQEFYKTIGMSLKCRLSFRDDGEEYLGSAELWEKAQKTIEELAKANKLDYFVGKGDAAFYGPKIDFLAIDNLDREWQVGTVQLDFVQPERFGLTYIDEDDKKQTPVMVHSAILGSIERFLGVYIEHTGGKFPVWLAPEQLRIMTINNDPSTISLASKFYEYVTSIGIRATIDDSNETLGKKIRRSEMQKVPHKFVVGPQERDAMKEFLETVNPSDWDKSPPAEFFAKIKKEINERRDQKDLYK